MERSDHQSQQAPTVVIVQQPVIQGSGTLLRGQPYLRRGVKLNNGTKIGARCISCLGVTGSVLTFMGLIFCLVGVSIFMGILFLLSGVGMLAACIKFCHKAKQDYDALPQDHPDRVIYSMPVFRPHRGGRGAFPITTATTAYQLAPGTQVINPAAIPGGHHILTNYQLPSGAPVISPSMSTQPLGPFPRNSVILSQDSGMAASCSSASSVPLQPVSPLEDKPPSYEEVCKAAKIQ